MGFFRRHRGESTAARSNVASSVTLNVTYFSKLRDDASLQVVGEHFRQEYVRSAVPPRAGDLPEGMPDPPPGRYKALVMPEPTNQYDRNALKVDLWARGQWVPAGYLSRQDAVLYAPLFRHLGRDGGSPPAIVADAALIDENGEVGVVLHLGTPGECIAELITDNRQPVPHPWVGQIIVFTESSRTMLTGVLVDRPAQLMLAAWAGCDVLSRVTKKVQALVAANVRDLTNNTAKAREYGIPIVPEPEFLRGIGLPPEAITTDERWARG